MGAINQSAEDSAPLTSDAFAEIMCGLPLAGAKSIAAGISGGPDSMALGWLLSGWCAANNISLIVYIVDHGLRPESADEAQQVLEWIQGWPHVYPNILRWEGDKPDSRIMESARSARYDLMAQDMKDKACRFLFLAHHQDDQAETFLIRLAKGSGLDGLASMKTLQDTEDGVTLVRPLLNVPKARLVATCIENKIPYVEDPSNENEKYLRPRLRASKAVLEEEGLTSKRLATTARRLLAAREALEEISAKTFADICAAEDEKGFTFDWERLRQSPYEIILRVILQAIGQLNVESTYGPRLEKVEALTHSIMRAREKSRDTLGGCLFTFDPQKAILKIEKEHS